MTLYIYKRLLSAGIAISAFSTPAFADSSSVSSQAENGFYGTASAGFVSPEDINHSNTDYSVDTGFSGEFGLGYRFNENVRAEFTYGTNSIEVENSTTRDGVARSFLASAYYDFDNGNDWTPYIGGGLGVTTLDTDLSSDSDDSALGYQAKIGIAYSATDSVDVFAEAVYQGMGETNVGNSDWDEFGMWGGRFGTRINF